MLGPGEAEYSTAKGYVQAMFLIMTNPNRFQTPDDRTFMMPFNMLAGFAAELYFKSYLAAKGHVSSDLRRQNILHDLVGLYALCEANGLQSDGGRWLVDTFGKQHKIHEFRYLNAESMYEMVDLRLVFEAFSGLDCAVDGFIGASSSRGRKPGGRWSMPAGLEWRSPLMFYGLRATKVTLG